MPTTQSRPPWKISRYPKLWGQTDVRPRWAVSSYWTVIVTGAVWLSEPDLPVTMSVTCCGVAI